MKVLICTDGSTLSEKAVEAAIGVAKPLNAELVGITVIAEASLKGAPETVKRLKQIEEMTKEAGLDCTIKAVVAPAPWIGITETAKEEEVDFVVMASRGMGSIGSLLLGSETQKTLSSIDRPVLVVR
ncbi:MAG TPA: universal stress protein [Sutterella sp.]|nr:universal stress protein [Sutterella sp.]